MGIFDDALKERFVTSTSAVAVTSNDTLLIYDAETGVVLKLPVSVLTSAINALAPVQSVAGKTGTVTLVKADVGLSNVDNTSDANKPISTETQTALNGKEGTIAAGTTAQYWRGDKSWRDFATDIRAAVLTGLSTATNAAITASDSVLSAFGKLQKQISDNLTTLTTHTANTSNPHSVTKSQVGLSNVDNTSDANKPVSTAQQTALNAKANAALESWIAPTLGNSWVDYGSPYNTAAYYKDNFGIVHLKGLIKNGTIGSAAFTLPVGYRPTGTEFFATQSGGAFATARVNAAGDVIPYTGGNSYFSLDGLTFRAA